MKRFNPGLLNFFLFFMLATLSSCEAIAGIFKAGMWTGIIVVVLVVALVIYLIGKGTRK